VSQSSAVSMAIEIVSEIAHFTDENDVGIFAKRRT
jgi:hypothetical protein